MEVLIPFLSNLVSGVIGGNLAGMVFKKISLGAMGNSLAGLVGGGLAGELVEAILNANFGADALGIVAELLIGGAGGAVFTFVIGLIRRYVAK